MDLDSPGEMLFGKYSRMEICGHDADVFEHMCVKHRYKDVELIVQFLPDMKSKDFSAITSVRALGTPPRQGSRYVHHCDGPFTVRNITEYMAVAIDEMHFRVDVGVWAPKSLVRNDKTWAYDEMIHRICMLLKS